jgi:hypothetical protein
MAKPYNWRTDYDWTDPDDAPVGGFDETVVDETELMLPKDARGLDSLREGRNMEVATSGPSHRISELIEKSNNGTITEEEKIELEMLMEMTPMMARGGRIGYRLGDEVVEDDLSTIEFMQDQGIPYGEQASGIDPQIRIEEVVKEFIKRKGRRPRSIEEIKTFYMEEMAGGAGGPQRVAYNPGDYDPMMVDEYEKYKFDMNEQKPGFPIMEIDEFIQMEKANMASGGLPGILGV